MRNRQSDPYPVFRKHFSPFLALRYLKPKRSFVSVITLISVLGVALGVMFLLPATRGGTSPPILAHVATLAVGIAVLV